MMLVRTLFAAILTLLCTVAPAMAQASIKRQLDIAPQALGAALAELARQAKVQVIYSADLVEGLRSPRIEGSMTAEEAMQRMLPAARLKFEFVDDNTITLVATPQGAAHTNGSENDAEAALRLTRADAAREGASVDQSAASQAGRAGAELSKDRSVRSDALEEVVVTAQKRVERLREVPVPVAAISGEVLASSNQLRLQDYYNKIPGLGLVTSGNGGQPVIAIRGITTGGDTNPTVGIVVDEVSYGASVNTGFSTPAVVDIDPGDLARVEVLRGPQGTLYGAASMGGLLKFVTVDPSTEGVSGRLQAGTTSVSNGSELGRSLRGGINVPIGNSLALRASAFTVRDPGYVDNAETGKRDVNRRDSDGARLSALWRPSDAWSVKLGALFQDSQRHGTDDIDLALGADDPKQSFLTGTGQYERRTAAYSATVRGEMGDAELVSASGYSVDESRDNVDFTLCCGSFHAGLAAQHFGVNRASILQHNEVEKFTQELRVSLPLASRVDGLFGVFYTREDTFRDNDLRASDSAGNYAGTYFKTAYDTGKFEEYAAFASLTVDVTDRMDIQFGGRYSDDEQVYPIVASGPQSVIWNGSDPFVSAPLKAKGSAFTYLVTPRWKLSPDFMLYARLASGYRPGGANNACTSTGVPCEYKPDKTRNYDVGLKGSALGGALFVDASLYYIDWSDIQISGILPAGAAFGAYTGNVSRARSQGVELSAELKPRPGLVVASWVAYNDASLTASFPPGQLFGAPGDRLPYSSRLSGNFSLDQTIPLNDRVALFAGATASYVGDRKGNFQFTASRQTFPSYTQVDLRLGLQHEGWTLTAFANNLTDERGVLRGGLDAFLIPSYFTYILPRTVGVNVGYVW